MFIGVDDLASFLEFCSNEKLRRIRHYLEEADEWEGMCKRGMNRKWMCVGGGGMRMRKGVCVERG